VIPDELDPEPQAASAHSHFREPSPSALPLLGRRGPPPLIIPQKSRPKPALRRLALPLPPPSLTAKVVPRKLLTSPRRGLQRFRWAERPPLFPYPNRPGVKRAV